MLSEREFLTIYKDSMTYRYPQVKFKIADNRTIIGEHQGKEVRQYIDNAFLEYKTQPDSLGPILHRYVQSAVEVYELRAGLNQENIVPVIKPISYVKEMEKVAADAGAKKGLDLVYQTYNTQLVIAYAEDTPNGINYFSSYDFKKLGISQDSLRPIATRNLYRLLSNMQVKGGNGTFMIVAGGNYEASILLLDDVWTKENIPVDGDFVIGVPSRDVLLVTGSNDKDGISKLREAVKKTYQTGTYNLSDHLYKRVEGKFIQYD
jgi:uncharacterized protein YtpQ (UPF0354 family)